MSDERKEEKEGRHARYTREGQERKERQKEERTKEEDDCDTDDHGDAKEQKEEWKGESHRISDVGSGIDIGMDIQDKSGYEREHDRKALCNYESQSDDAVASDDTHVINITGINRRFQSLRSEIRNQVSAILSMSGGTNE